MPNNRFDQDEALSGRDHEYTLQEVTDPKVEQLLRRILARLEEMERNMKTAFVGGDYDGHRRAHEQFIADLQARRELRRAVIDQVVKGSVWALLVVVATALWQYLKVKVQFLP